MKDLNREELEQFSRIFEELFYSGDFHGLTSHYADGATILAENTELVHGHQAIEHFQQITCEAAKKIGMKRAIDLRELEATGNLGYVTGTVTLKIPLPDNQFKTSTVRYATVWKRKADGAWRIVIDISNRGPAQLTIIGENA